MTIRLVLAFLALLSIHGSCEVNSARPASKTRTVVVFGDSITAGGSLPKDQRDKAWVNVVARQTQDQLTWVNEGKGGRPTNSIPEFEAMLGRHSQVDTLVIALGTNDSRDISDACVPKAVANVRAMVERARKTYGAKIAILLVGPPNILKSSLGPTKVIGDQREAQLRALGAAFSALAGELGCEFIDLFGVIPDSSLAGDGVHPDVEGHAVIARWMRQKLLPMK